MPPLVDWLVCQRRGLHFQSVCLIYPGFPLPCSVKSVTKLSSDIGAFVKKFKQASSFVSLNQEGARFVTDTNMMQLVHMDKLDNDAHAAYDAHGQIGPSHESPYLQRTCLLHVGAVHLTLFDILPLSKQEVDTSFYTGGQKKLRSDSWWFGITQIKELEWKLTKCTVSQVKKLCAWEIYQKKSVRNVALAVVRNVANRHWWVYLDFTFLVLRC